MKLSFKREDILGPLSHVIGVVEKRQTMPILANVLFTAQSGTLFLTATDTEIEIQAKISTNIEIEGQVTVPARKLFDICKAISENQIILFELVDSRLHLKSGKSNFVLSTLPASEFPLSESISQGTQIELSSFQLIQLLKKTSFSMAIQDVRFYLNGLLVEITHKNLKCVSTDGHRLAYASCSTDAVVDEPIRAIIPRKSVLELIRLIGQSDENNSESIYLTITQNHLKIIYQDITLTTKLIDGRFPDYTRVIPTDCDNELIIDKSILKETLSRAAILSNEKYKGIRLQFDSNKLYLSTNNPEQEQANDEIDIVYDNEKIDIGFNVSYLLDAFSRITTENVRFLIKNSSSSCLIMPIDNDDTKYVVMPMRL